MTDENQAGNGAQPQQPTPENPNPNVASEPALAERAANGYATPTPGRIVMFTNEEGDAYPAIVSDVNDTQIHLTVFDAVMGPRLYAVDITNHGDDRRHWRWPSRG